MGTTTKKKTGRKTKVDDPKVLTKLDTALRSGATRKACAIYAGISESSFYGWMERGEADEQEGKETVYSEFLELVTRAEAAAEINAATTLSLAMAKDWRAAAHFLERRRPEHWGRTEKHEVKHEGQIRTDIPELPDTVERLESVAGILAGAGVLK